MIKIKSILKKIFALILGLLTVFKHAFKARVTGEYPEDKVSLPKTFRGKHNWNASKCIGCKICVKSCPAGAISIEKSEANSSFRIDMNKCIFCGNCMYYCPKSAISMTDEYELATDKKENLIFEINSLNSSADSNIIKDE